MRLRLAAVDATIITVVSVASSIAHQADVVRREREFGEHRAVHRVVAEIRRG
jgi:hypothetical protein